MSIEAFVLRGQDRVDHVRRNIRESQLATKPLFHARFAQRNAVAVQQANALHRRSQKRGGNRRQAHENFGADDERQRDQPSSLFHSSGRALIRAVSVVPDRSG